MTAQLFHNSRILTMDEHSSEAQAVAVQDGRIVVAGAAGELRDAVGAGAEDVDCAGGILIPAFIDAHCHLLSYASSLLAVDCTQAGSVADIQNAIRGRAEATPAGGWIKATGYEETRLAEGRHPTARELDAATTEHPVRLSHSSGHARVLNSLAMRLAGIDGGTEEPTGGVIERDIETGEPNGVLIGMERVVDEAVPNLSYEELSEAVRQASGRMLSAGITCIQDATHTNGASEWALFERLMTDGSLLVDVVMMEGAEHIGEVPESALDGRLIRGPVKVMLHELEHMEPDASELDAMRQTVREAHAGGRQVAIHAVGEHAIRAALDAIESALEERPRADHRHRIEHCGMLPEGAAERIARLGVTVVSQPSFVHARGDRYLRLLSNDQIGRMYAFRTLGDAGVPLAAGSDAPVTPPDPLGSIAAAASRSSASGASIGASEAVDRYTALRWWTAGAAHAAFEETDRGVLQPGAQADMALLPAGALEMRPDRLMALRPESVWRRGRRVAFDSGRS